MFGIIFWENVRENVREFSRPIYGRKVRKFSRQKFTMNFQGKCKGMSVNFEGSERMRGNFLGKFLRGMCGDCPGRPCLGTMLLSW